MSWFARDSLESMVVVCAILGAGCAVPVEETTEYLGSAEEAAIIPNSLSPAALVPSATDPAALRPADLAAAPLLNMSAAALAAVQDPGGAGALSRQFLRYAVGCALDGGSAVSVSWTSDDGAPHTETFAGSVGLAPAWATQPLTGSAQVWVSDCMAARVNALGTEVMLSLRGTPAPLAASTVELLTFPVREAAFFGNLFTSAPVAYVCYDATSVLSARLAQRLCAQPELLNVTLGSFSCGAINVLGPCSLLLGFNPCTSSDPISRYYNNCAPSSGAPMVPAITTFLPL